jgi:hypothetical protein
MRPILARLRSAAPTVLLALTAPLGSACSSGSTSSAPAAGAGDGGPKQVEGPDAGPSPGQVTLAAGITAYALSVDATNVYASTQTSIVKVPIAGGAPVTLVSVSSQDDSIEGLAVSSDSVYWSESGESDGGSEVLILSVPIAGGTVATIATESGFASALATDATSLYWSGSATTGTCPAPPCSTLSKAPLAGGTPLLLSSNAGNPTYLAFDDANVYWSTSDGRLLKEPKSGGSVTTLADFSTSIVGLGLQGSTLYWGTSGGDVYTTPSGGGTSKPIEIGLESIQTSVVGADGVYWIGVGFSSSSASSDLARTPLDGGATQTLWTLQSDDVYAMAMDSKSVYVSTYMSGLLKLAK